VATARHIQAFPIPIIIGTLGEKSRSLNEQLISNIVEEQNNNTGENRTGVGVFQTRTHLEKSYEGFSALSEVLSIYARDSIGNTGTPSSSAKVESMWANVNSSPNAFHMPHSHSLKGDMWNGVYFPTSGLQHWSRKPAEGSREDLDLEPELMSSSNPPDGSLVLMDPLEFVKSGVASKNTSRYPHWGNPLVVQPKEGTVVLFPTYLPHMVTPTLKKDWVRMSIAFYVKIDDE